MLRNICCEGSEEEIELVFNGFGEAPLFEVIERKLAASDPDCLEQVSSERTRGRTGWILTSCLLQLMFVLYNICLGNEKHREAVLSRAEVCKGMMHALVSSSFSVTNTERALIYIGYRICQSSESPLIKIPAIGCFANLVETNDRHRREWEWPMDSLKSTRLD